MIALSAVQSFALLLITARIPEEWERLRFHGCLSAQMGHQGVPLVTGPWSLVPGPFLQGRHPLVFGEEGRWCG